MTLDPLALSAQEIDALPFGYIALAPDGTIRKYNRYEADLARKDPQQVLGKNFFREVAPCTQVQEFEGRFHRFAAAEGDSDPTLSFDFEFPFRHGAQKVRIGFVRTPLEQEIIMTVHRVRDLELSLSADLRYSAEHGQLHTGAGEAVVAASEDFWAALDHLFVDRPPAERRAELHRLGTRWGLQHALRVEGFVQRQHGQTLREIELQMALQCLSGSVGVIGLGHFDIRLDFRRRGILLVEHHGSPFTRFFEQHDGMRCAVLAGLHAGFLSYISGRSLEAREISCSELPDTPCRFLVGTERRLEQLLDPAPGSADADLWLALGVRPPSRDGEHEVGDV